MLLRFKGSGSGVSAEVHVCFHNCREGDEGPRTRGQPSLAEAKFLNSIGQSLSTENAPPRTTRPTFSGIN